MEWTEQLRAGLDVAINEADLSALRINERTGEVHLLFVVLTLPENGPEPDDRRRVLALSGCSRLVATLREAGRRGQERIAALRLGALPGAVRDFGSQPVSGWEFFDLEPVVSEAPVSLELDMNRGRGDHSIDLVLSDAFDRHHRLDFRIEFDELSVFDGDEQQVELDDFVAGGRRWWQALRDGDPRVQDHGIRVR